MQYRVLYKVIQEPWLLGDCIIDTIKDKFVGNRCYKK